MAENVDAPAAELGVDLNNEEFGIIFDELYKGFNGSSTTGLAKADIQLSASAKFLKIDPRYLPKSDSFYTKLEEWTKKEHGMYTFGLVGSVRRFMRDTLEAGDYTTMLASKDSQPAKYFYLMCGAVQALSTSHMIAINLKETLGMVSMKELYAAPETAQANESYVADHATWTNNRSAARELARQEHDLATQDREDNQRKLEGEAERRLGSAPALRATLVTGFAANERKYKSRKDVRQAIEEYVSANGNEVFKCLTDADCTNLPVKPSAKRGPGSSTDADEEPTEESRGQNARLYWAQTWFDRVVVERTVAEVVEVFTGDADILAGLGAVYDFAPLETWEERLDAVDYQYRDTEPRAEDYGGLDNSAFTTKLKAEYVRFGKRRPDIIYDGSVRSEATPPDLTPSADLFRAASPYLNCDNLLSLVRYMVVLAKLNWFRTNHHTGTELNEIAPNLRDALGRALGTMPVEIPGISSDDVRAFINQYLHTISHWASTHMVFCGLYMPSGRAIAGEFYWSRHPSLSCLIRPDDDVKRRLLAAPANVSKYYLSNAGFLQFINSPAWALLNKQQLMTISQTVEYAQRIQTAARATFSVNERRIRACNPDSFYVTISRCRSDGRFNYHPAHNFMNAVQQMTVPDCQAIGIIGMVVMALHPTSTLARAPCFGRGSTDRTNQLALYRGGMAQETEMNTALAGYDEETFVKLKSLVRALLKGSDTSVKALATTSNFNQESVEILARIGRKAGIHSTALAGITANLTRTISQKVVTPDRKRTIWPKTQPPGQKQPEN